MRSIRARKQESGVSILLVAVSLAALLAMAALAIDVVTLYVASTEAQRAADAGALAGARMIAGSGYTSSPSSWNPSDLCQPSGPGAAALANQQAEAVAAQNLVAGQPAKTPYGTTTIDCFLTPPTPPGNPRIKVTIQRTNIPTFFARIWGRTASSVTARSTAEAYNPSGFPVPIQVSGVKPFLVPNCDPNPANTAEPSFQCAGNLSRFVSAVDGSITNGGSFIGETIDFQRINTGTTPAFTPAAPPTPAGSQFYSLDVDPPPTLCPSTSAVSCDKVGSGDNYLDNIACSSAFQFSCDQGISIGGSPIAVLSGGGLGVRTREGTQCLIHASGTGLPPAPGQDRFTPNGSGNLVQIDGGDNNPNLALRGQSNISRSDSVVTVPLYGGSCIGTSGPGCSPTTKVVGFLQLGIMETETGPTKIRAVILNAAGCNGNASGTPVTGGGISAIPVRLFH